MMLLLPSWRRPSRKVNTPHSMDSSASISMMRTKYCRRIRISRTRSSARFSKNSRTSIKFLKSKVKLNRKNSNLHASII